MPSKLDKARAEQKSVMASKLDNTRREQKPSMPSKLDKSAAEKSKMASKLDNSRVEKSKLASRLDQAKMEGLASRLDKTSLDTEFPETAMSAVTTTFTNSDDVKMASRQTNYDTLPPSEQQKQEKWAQQKIRDIGICPAGYDWIRVPGGYNCWGGSHWMTDELLAAGHGGWYMRNLGEDQRMVQSMAMRRRGLARSNPLQEIEMLHGHFRGIGFSNGLEGFSGPYGVGFRRDPVMRLINPNQPLGLNGLVYPGIQSPDRQQRLQNIFNAYNNQHGLGYGGRRPFLG